MTGRMTEAEDVVQEAYLRWHRSEVEVENVRAFLSSIVTRLCLDFLKSSRHRREVYPGTWLPEPVPSQSAEYEVLHHETLRFSALRLLQELSPKERAAFLLREVLRHEYHEIADWLEVTPENCRQLVSRSRGRLQLDKKRFSAPAKEIERLLGALMDSLHQGQYEKLKSLLKEDITLWSDGGGKAPSAIQPIFGSDKVVRFFMGIAQKKPNSRAWLGELNGLPARLTHDGIHFRATIFDGDSDGFQVVYIISNPDKLISTRSAHVVDSHFKEVGGEIAG